MSAARVQGDFTVADTAIPHLNDYEGDPEARPFTREEMQRFLDYADEQVDRAVAANRKGALTAYRDATLGSVNLTALSHFRW